MLSPLPIEEDIRDPADDPEIRWIRRTYSKSGLYRNDGSTEPIWEYDGLWLNESIIIAPDGEHLILPGGWTGDEHQWNAVLFMRREQTLGHYYAEDIVSQWILQTVLNGFKPPRCVGTSFNSRQMTYTIRTNQGEEFVFDVTSGRIIESRSPFPELYAVAVVVLISFSVILVAWWKRARQRLTN